MQRDMVLHRVYESVRLNGYGCLKENELDLSLLQSLLNLRGT